MEFVKQFFDKDEQIEFCSKCSFKSYLKNVLLANFLYIIMWVAFDLFFVYLLTKDAIVQKYWFTILPLAGLNILKVWTSVFAYLKEKNDMNNSGYVMTNKAFYEYVDNKYKVIKKIKYEDIYAVEKSDYIVDGFFLASKTDCIKVVNTPDSSELFTRLVKKAKPINN